MVKLLAEAKAQINIQTEVYTLHAYITCMYIGYLHYKKCSLLICVQDGRTALYIACWKGHMSVVKQLLQKYADVSIRQKVYTIRCVSM